MDQTIVGMCSAGIALFLIGFLSAKNDVARARGLEKIVSVSNACFAIPLAVFGALHLFGPRFVMDIVPEYMPWRSFWVYFVGVALIAASLSIATGRGERWAGLLLGAMMFLFVAMIHLPGALSDPNDRFIWTIVLRELSFGGAGWIMAGSAESVWPVRFKSTLMLVGRVFVTMALIFFAVEHFLHPMGLPGVPLRKEMPAWVTGGVLIDYLTGAGLLAAGLSIPLRWKTRIVATSLGGWILLTILVIYGPVLVGSLAEPEIGAKLEGINYFADTLLFAGVILTLAKATPANQRNH